MKKADRENHRPVALVTGGARRVGRQIAISLAEAGFDVAITFNKSASDAAETLDSIQQTGTAAFGLRADLTDCDSAPHIAASVIETFGRLDVLVNNASIYEPGGIKEAKDGQLADMWAIHYRSPLLLCRSVEKQLRKSRGHIVNMLDVLAEKPMPSHAVYCASKAALWNLTLSLARELAPNVTVNGIAPGVVDWPADYPKADRTKYLRRVPLGRAGTPLDVANAVVFFCTKAPYVTGQVLRLDGGRSLT